MRVKKISISLDSEVFERANRAAEADGIALSTWLSEAAGEAAGLAEARAALAEDIEVYGSRRRHGQDPRPAGQGRCRPVGDRRRRCCPDDRSGTVARRTSC